MEEVFFKKLIDGKLFYDYIKIITRVETVKDISDKLKTLELLKVTIDFLKSSEDNIEGREYFINLCQYAKENLSNKKFLK